MFCKFIECDGTLVSRECFICKEVSHHLCSNEFLYSLNLEVESHISLCSRECVDSYFSCNNNEECNDKVINNVNTKRINQRNNYIVSFKSKVIQEVTENKTITEVANNYNIPRKTLSNWMKQKDDILNFKGNQFKRRRLLKKGVTRLIHFDDDLYQYLKDLRRSGISFNSRSMVKYIYDNHYSFYDDYINVKKKKRNH